jgi:hypothetical protein
MQYMLVVAAIWLGCFLWRAFIALGTLKQGLGALAVTRQIPPSDIGPYVDIAKASALIALVEMLFAAMCLALAITFWFSK